jgi:beta-glucanase (GH16 family)
MARAKMRMLSFLLVFVAFAVPRHGSGATLDLCGLEPTFVEDFKDLKVAAWKIGGNRWIAHTPWAGDFGDAAFSDPGPDFPFTLQNRALRIEARKDISGKWRSGLLASADASGAGFSQMYGYFEAKVKLPKGPGTWPAFWLNEVAPKSSTEPSVELDAMEFYGQFSDSYRAAFHVWHSAHPLEASQLVQVAPDSLSADFHSFGIEVKKDFISYFFDQTEVWRISTPSQHTRPFMVLVDLALGSGWPIDKTPNPSVMDVEYVHVYQRQELTCNK